MPREVGAARIFAGLCLALLGLAACELPKGVLFKCEAGGTCTQGDAMCWSDGYCHSMSEGNDPDSGAGGSAGQGGGGNGGAGGGAGAAGGAGGGLGGGGAGGGGTGGAGGGAACEPLDASVCPLDVECGFIDAGCGLEIDCHRACQTPGTQCGVKVPNQCGIPSLCTGSGWCWENPLPQGNSLNDSIALDVRHMWFVGDNATVVFYDSDKTTLLDTGVAPTVDFRGVSARAPDDVYVVGTAGTFVHFDGTSWTQEGTTTSFTGNVLGVWAGSGGQAWAIAEPNLIFARRPAQPPATRWAPSSFSPTPTAPRAVGGFPPADSWVLTLTGALYRLNPQSLAFDFVADLDAGLTMPTLLDVEGKLVAGVQLRGDGGWWVAQYDLDAGWSLAYPSPTSTVSTVAGTTLGSLYATAAGGGLWHREDGGWVHYGSFEPYNTVAVAGPSQAAAAGNSGAMGDCCDPGLRSLSYGTTRTLTALCGASSTLLFAPGTSTTLTDGGCPTTGCTTNLATRSESSLGASWALLPPVALGDATNRNLRLNGCFAQADGHLWAYNDDAKFITRLDGGLVGGDFGGANFAPYSSAWGADGGPWYFAGGLASVLTTTNGAATGQADFTKTNLAGSKTSVLWGNAANDIFAVGTGNTWFSYNGAWQNQASPAPSDQLLAAHGQSGFGFIAVGDGGVVWERRGPASGATIVRSVAPIGGQDLRAVWMSPAGRSWAAGGNLTAAPPRTNALVVHLTDAGTTVETLPTWAQLNGIWGLAWPDGGISVWVSGDRGAILRRDSAP